MDNDESSKQANTETGCENDEKEENPVNLTSKLTENDEKLENVISKLKQLHCKLELSNDLNFSKLQPKILPRSLMMKSLKLRIKLILVILEIAMAMERALAFVEKQFQPMFSKSERVVMERRRKFENHLITKIFNCGALRTSIRMKGKSIV